MTDLMPENHPAVGPLRVEAARKGFEFRIMGEHFRAQRGDDERLAPRTQLGVVSLLEQLANEPDA